MSPLTKEEKQRFSAYLDEVAAENKPKIHALDKAGDAEGSRRARNITQSCSIIKGLLKT